MNTELQKKCELFIKNRDIIKNSFKWDGDLIALAGSSLFTSMGITIDTTKLKECDKILKKYFGSFSEFRGTARIPMICQMAIVKNPEQYLLKVKETYELMNKNSVVGSDSKLMSAITICSRSLTESVDKYIERTDSIYEQMKEKHKWLTSTNDLPFAAMLAVSDLDTDALFTEMEKCFEILKDKFEKNAAQSLSHVLALCEGEADKKCKKIFEIYDGLKNAKHAYGSNYELASLGVTCSLDMDNEQIIKEICEVDDYLKGQKGFGSLSISSYSRRMYATLIVVNAHNTNEQSIQNAVINNIVSMTLSMELCMFIILFA